MADETQICNRIITRGFGLSRGKPGRTGPVVQGFGPCTPAFVVQALVGVPRHVKGRSGVRQPELDTVILWAKLIEVNSNAPKKKVEGFVRVPSRLAQMMVEVKHVATRLWDKVRVTVKRIK